MRQVSGWIGVLGITLALAGNAVAQDDPRATPLFDVRFTIHDILSVAKDKGKAMVVMLGGGVTYVGKVKAVGDHAVILTGLQGKEFFDAYVPLDSIVALEERVRLR